MTPAHLAKTTDITAASEPQFRAELSLRAAQQQFTGGRGYLAACTVGLPTTDTRAAVIAELDAAGSGHPDPLVASVAVENSRAHFARLVGVSPALVAIGSQASVFAGLVAAGMPDGAEVLCADGDFSSIMLPFAHAGRGIRVRTAPLEHLAASITDQTWLVAFSIVQSATGDVADADAIVEAAERHGTYTLCDATQAVGWMPVDGTMFDAVICHAYKWLCAPRGVAFCALSEQLGAQLTPIFAGWYAGADPWSSCYGHDLTLASDASRFDVSPAWQAFVGAEPALALFAAIDRAALYAHTSGLAASFRDARGIPQPTLPSAIVTWSDQTGCDLARLTMAGITASGRAGRARVAFHLFNDAQDLADAVHALSM